MLTGRFILILAALALATAVAAVFAQHDRWSKTIRTLDTRPAFAGFAEQLPAVGRIRVQRADGHDSGSFSFLRQDDRWVMDSKGNYPALQGAIRELLIGFSELQLVEAKTANPDRHHKLHLRDVSLAGSMATRIVVEDADGAVLLDGLFGKPVPSISGGTPSIYMRQAGAAQTWLAKGELDIRGSAREWLPVPLLSIQRERIARIVYTTPGAPPLELVYNTSLKRFDIVDMPEDRKITSRYKLLQSAIESERLSFQDVHRADGLEADPALGSAVWHTKDGLTVTLGYARDGSAPADAPPLAVIAVETSADAGETVRQEASELIDRTREWAFALGPETMERLRATLDNLTEPKVSG